MKISVFGTGYVGLVTAVCLAESGNHVIGFDIDESKINNLRKGIPTIYEKGLEELLTWNLKNKRLNFTTDPSITVKNSDIIFIAVGTPSNPDGSCNLSYVFDCVRTILSYANSDKIIVIKSTVPVGTAKQVKEFIRDSKYRLYICSNPEFLKEGVAIEDFMKPDRVIIGADDEYVFEVMRELYAPFVRNEKPIICMDNESAEMTKYAANALLAVKISFMNEIALLCEKVNADVEMVRKGVGADYRIGYQFLFPGVGFGGSCFPKDLRALINLAEKNNFDLMIPKSAYNVNERQKKHLLNKIFAHFGENLTGKTFGIWGLSFKPNTDDMREAPSIVIINGLLSAGAKIRAFDPKAMDEAKKIFGDRIYYAESDYDALESADALVLITEWQEFRNPDFGRIKELLKSPVIFDGRNQYNPKKMKELGFIYYGIGRKNV